MILIVFYFIEKCSLVAFPTSYSSFYTKHKNLKKLVPKVRKNGRRRNFIGLCWEDVVSCVPRINKYVEAEVAKKRNRETAKNLAILEEDEKTGLHNLPSKHIEQTARDKKVILCQFGAFLQLIEGEEKLFMLRDIIDIVKVEAFLSLMTK